MKHTFSNLVNNREPCSEHACCKLLKALVAKIGDCRPGISPSEGVIWRFLLYGGNMEEIKNGNITYNIVRVI